jgi:serine-threonine kinase receptor-associated protein
LRWDQGGNEKKIRLFDLGRPDAEPLVLGGDYPGNTSCKGTVRSLVWDEGQGGVVGISAGEDGFVRWWDLRTLKQTSCLDMGEPVNSMEMVHGGGTLSVTSGKTVHFLDIMGYVSAGLSD